MTYSYSSVVIADSSAPVASVVTGVFTLSQSATLTTVSLPGATTNSKAFWMPTTPDAAAIFPFLSGTCGTNALNLTHPSNPSSDLTFSYIAYLY